MKKDLRTKMLESRRKKPSVALTLEIEDIEYLDRIVIETRTSRSWVVRELLRKNREMMQRAISERLQIGVPGTATIQA